MSASLRMRFGVAAAISCIVVGYAVAQQPTGNPGQIKPTNQKNANDQNAIGQSDRATTPQGERPATAPNKRAQKGQPYAANFRGTSPTGGTQEQQVERYLAGCLLTNNQAEIEIAQIAQKQSQNPEVKQFAEMLVKDHGELTQKLQQLAGSQHGNRADGQNDVDRDRNAADTSRAPGANVTDQARDTNENPSLNPGNRADAGGGAFMQLAAINKKIAERCTQATKEELQSKSGAQFDECFVGTQIGGHMHMLAALEVIGEESQGQLRQVAEDAKPKLQQHLEQAKQLAEQLKSSSNSGDARAERPRTRTER